MERHLGHARVGRVGAQQRQGGGVQRQAVARQHVARQRLREAHAGGQGAGAPQGPAVGADGQAGRGGHGGAARALQQRQPVRQAVGQPDVVLVRQRHGAGRQVGMGQEVQEVRRGRPAPSPASSLARALARPSPRPVQQADLAPRMGVPEGRQDGPRAVGRAVVAGPEAPLDPLLRQVGGQLRLQMGRAPMRGQEDAERRHLRPPGPRAAPRPPPTRAIPPGPPPPPPRRRGRGVRSGRFGRPVPGRRGRRRMWAGRWPGPRAR